MKKLPLVALLATLSLALFCAPALAEGTPSLFDQIRSSSLLKKLFEMEWYTALTVVVIAVLGIVLLRAGKQKWNSDVIAKAAMCIAIAFVLSCIRIWRSPYGGSVTPASMLPMMAFVLAFGPLKGAVAGLAYGLLNLTNGPYIVHPVQMLLDYLVAYAAIALGGFAGRLPVHERFKLPIAIVIGAFARWVMAVLSGVVFFADAAGDTNALIYSMGYNFGYLGPDTLLCVLVAFIPGINRIARTLKGSRSISA